MKKFTKLFASLILVALLVSALAVFGAFAEEAAAPEPEVKTYFDSNNASLTTSNKVNGVPVIPKTEENGVSIWNYSFPNVPAGANPATNNHVSIFEGKNDIRIRDDAAVSGGRAGGAKNTDYIVVDFDVATDTEFLDLVLFNFRLYGSGATTSLGSTSTHPAIGKDADGRIYVSNANGKNKRYPVFDSDEKWTNITFVYDFHIYKNDEGVDTVSNTCYAYIDGYYVGTIGSLHANTSIVYFMRAQANSALTADNASTMFANFTVKTFGAGYAGPMTKLLGNSSSILQAPDLAYCFENTLSTPDGFEWHGKLADIKRGEEIIPVYNADDLHGDLLDGDVVTVYDDLAKYKSAYAVKMVYDEAAAADRAANVVWQDANGVTLGEEGSLFAPPTVIGVPSAADWVIIKSGAVAASGKNNSLASKASGSWVVYDPLYAARSTQKSGEVLFFADYVFYGPGKSTTVAEGDTTFSDAGVTPTSADSKTSRHASDVVYDLNGYTMTNATVTNHLIVGYGGDVTIKNGKVVHGLNGAGCSNLIAVTGSYRTTYYLFDNVDFVTTNASIVFDQRYGTIIFHDSKINIKDNLTSIKAVGNGHTSLVIDDCDVTGKGPIASAGQVSSSSQRQGGGNIGVTIKDSRVDISGTVFTSETYANGTKHTAAAYAANKVSYYLGVMNSDVKTYGALSSVLVQTVPGTNPTGTGINDTAEGFLDINLDVDITDSKIESLILLSPATKSADPAKVGLNADIDVKDSDLKLQRTETSGEVEVGGLTQHSTTYKDTAKVTVNLGEGVKLNTKNAARGNNTSKYVAPTVNIPEGYQLAYTSLDGYNFIVTKDVETYTYKLGEGDVVEFFWNKAEGDLVDIDKVVSLAKVDGVYHYEWINEGTAYTTKLVSDYVPFAKANLTLHTDISLNLYIPKAEIDNASINFEILNGYGAPVGGELVDIDGVAYYKFVSNKIAAVVADEGALNVKFTVMGKYGDAVTDTKAFTVVDYLASYEDTEVAEENALVDAIINYVVAAFEFAEKDTAALDAIRPAAPVVDENAAIKMGSVNGVSIAVKFGSEIAWALKGAPGTVVTVRYSAYGASVSEEIAFDEKGVKYLPTYAFDLLAGINVATADSEVFVNLEAYYLALTESADKNMVAAIIGYANAARVYKDILPVEAETEATLAGALKLGKDVIVEADLALESSERYTANGKSATAALIVPEGADVVIDLGGKTVTAPDTVYAIFVAGKAVIKNGTINSRGIYIAPGAELTVEEDVAINALGTDGGSAIRNYGGTVVLNGGTYTANNAAEITDVTVEAIAAQPAVIYNVEGTVTINGATVETNSLAYAISNVGGTMLIETANVTAKRGAISVIGGTTTINGGSFASDYDSSAYALYFEAAEGALLTVNGGTFSNPGFYDAYIETPDTVTVTLADGLFVAVEGMANMYNMPEAAPEA